MELIKKWYINKIDDIENDLNNVLKSQYDLEVTVITKRRLIFEKELGVYFLFEYEGIKNGKEIFGHARAFVKYLDKKIVWFSLEITYKDNPINSIVDYIINEYDDSVEEYFLELKKISEQRGKNGK